MGGLTLSLIIRVDIPKYLSTREFVKGMILFCPRWSDGYGDREWKGAVTGLR